LSLLGREWPRRLAVALIVGVAAGWFTLTDVGAWMHRAGLDYLFELRQRFHGPIYTPDTSRVAVVVIDEETYRTGELKGLPQVAWTPQIGKVLSAIALTDVRAVGFDLVYPTTLEPLIPGYDRPLRQAFARLGRSGRLVLGAVDSSLQPIYPEEGQILAAGGIGNVAILNLVTDGRDNVVREHLGFGRDGKGGKVPTLVGELARRVGVEAPERFIINYDTGRQDVPVYSFGDLLNCAAAGRSDFFEDAFRGKIVLVGSALDVEDRRIPAKRFVNAAYDGPTRRCIPLAADARHFGDSVERLTTPGVFIHAAALNTLLLDGTRLRFPPPLYTAAGTGMSIAFATFAFLNLTPLLGVLLLALGVVAVIAGSLWAMLGGVVLPVATMLLAALM
jgi:adenylate cyclase